MKEQALALVRGAADRGQAVNVLREYLQSLVLRSFHEAEAVRCIAFVGGTALRFLHGLPRFSEDLDFSLVSPNGYAGRAWMAKVKRDLALAGFTPEVTWNDRKTVHAAWVRLGGLLHDAGLSPMADEKLAIKVEVDTRPPVGGHCERRLVTRHLSFLLQYHDPPSLMAGKVHALLTRRYAKGRDWYDFVWYTSRKTPVNLELLAAALAQTGPWKGSAEAIDREWCLRALKAKIESIDWQRARDDVRAFLRPSDTKSLEVWGRDFFLSQSGKLLG